MQELAERAVTDLVTLLESGIQEIPPYLTDLIHRCALYGIALNWMWVLFGIVIMVISIWLSVKEIKSDFDYDWWLLAAWISLWSVAIIVLVICISNLFQAILTPEIYTIHLI